MIEKVITEMFKKARQECASDAKSTLADHIADEIVENYGFVSGKTVLRAYEKYIDPKKEEIGTPSKETIDLFCNYLGHENYKSYVNAKKESSSTKAGRTNTIPNKVEPVHAQKSKWPVSIALLTIICILGLLLFKVSGIGDNVDTIANRCLYWEVDRYRPIDCDKILPQIIAKTKVAFNQVLYSDFRKVSKDEIATFSKALWKGASPTGEMDYFAAEGVHPLTQKKLVRVAPVTLKSGFKKGEPEIVTTSETKKNAPKTIGVLIFEDQNLDKKVIGQLERTYFKKYGSFGNVLASNSIDHSKKTALLAGNFESLNKNTLNKLDYISVGNISYTFKKSKLSSETISCRLSLDYTVYTTSSGIRQNELSQFITVTGIGFSEEEAKTNALKKIQGD